MPEERPVGWGGAIGLAAVPFVLFVLLFLLDRLIR